MDSVPEMTLHKDSYLVDLLNDVAEFLEGQADVKDGSYGEPEPNRAMSLQTHVEQALERLKRSSGPDSDDFKRAIELLEVCHGSCDLHFGLAFAMGSGDYNDPRSVHDEVGDFLKRINGRTATHSAGGNDGTV